MIFYGTFTKVGKAIQGWINGNYDPETPVIPRVYHKYLKRTDKNNIYPIDTLTIASVAGTSTGDTAITVTETKGAKNIYKYKLGTAAEDVIFKDDLSAWTTWNGTADITVASGLTTITLAECTSTGLAVAVGSAAVTVKEADPAPINNDPDDPLTE